jgi:hypothetical protein
MSKTLSKPSHALNRKPLSSAVRIGLILVAIIGAFAIAMVCKAIFIPERSMPTPVITYSTLDSESNSTLASLTKAKDAPYEYKCDDATVSRSQKADQSDFTSTHDFVNIGDNQAEYIVPNSGITIYYDGKDCRFSTKVSSQAYMADGNLTLQRYIDDQVDFRFEDGSPDRTAKLSTCGSVKAPQLHVGRGNQFSRMVMFCEKK